MRSIYANPYKYACKCDIPIELAKIACLKQRHFIKEQQKHPMYCPICEGWREACGAETHEEWLEFATKMIIGRRKLN